MKDAVELARVVLGPRHVSQQIDAQWKRPLETMARAVLKCADLDSGKLAQELADLKKAHAELQSKSDANGIQAAALLSKKAEQEKELAHLRGLFKDKSEHCGKVEAELAALRGPKLVPVS